jgi:hypothetical protein
VSRPFHHLTSPNLRTAIQPDPTYLVVYFSLTPKWHFGIVPPEKASSYHLLKFLVMIEKDQKTVDIQKISDYKEIKVQLF